MGVITCVVPGSNANSRGFKRGMLFTAVNDEIITPQNRETSIKALQAESVILQLAAFNNDQTALIDSVIETSRLPLSPIGQPGDLPVDKALTLIYGTTAVNVTSL